MSIISTPRNNKNEYLFKVLVVGDSGVGKTSFIKRYVHGIFQNQYKATIGVDFAFKHVEWNDKMSLRIQVWDIAGQERFSQMTRVYYKEAVAVLVFFDVHAGEKSLKTTKSWKTDVDGKVFLPNGEPVPCILVGNKYDMLQDGVSPISDEVMNNFVKENGYDNYFMASALTGHNVNESMDFLLGKVVDCFTRLQEEESTSKQPNASTSSSVQPSVHLGEPSVKLTTTASTSSGQNNSSNSGGCC